MLTHSGYLAVGVILLTVKAIQLGTASSVMSRVARAHCWTRRRIQPAANAEGCAGQDGSACDGGSHATVRERRMQRVNFDAAAFEPDLLQRVEQAVAVRVEVVARFPHFEHPNVVVPVAGVEPDPRARQALRPSVQRSGVRSPLVTCAAAICERQSAYSTGLSSTVRRRSVHQRIIARQQPEHISDGDRSTLNTPERSTAPARRRAHFR